MAAENQQPPFPPPLPPSAHKCQEPEREEKLKEPGPSVYLASLEAAGPNFENVWSMPPREGPPDPEWYFFYGTLTKPEILKHILDLADEPYLRPAKIIGYALSSWGQYPALIDGDTGQEVAGYAYLVKSTEDEEKLAYYETKAYRVSFCRICFTDSENEEMEEVSGKTFMYAGDADALKEGRFDRKLWEAQMGFTLPLSRSTSRSANG
ncbi:hypothetical protein F5Y18DRAFT_411389 [Xylariaceae sp. FL1019]|nr:hypothetical protein F5Y18DRAFT_411389 [Xylariaceae sp. FL1019]